MRRYSVLPNGGRQETLADRAHRYRGIVLVILAPPSTATYNEF
jgi:apyrase